MKGICEYDMENSKMNVSKVEASESMDMKEVKEAYERNVCVKLTKARLIVGEGVSISEVFSIFKDAVITVPAKLFGSKPHMV